MFNLVQNLSNLLTCIDEAWIKEFKKFESDKFDVSKVLEMVEGRQ